MMRCLASLLFFLFLSTIDTFDLKDNLSKRCSAYQTGGELIDIKARVKSLIYNDKNVFGYETYDDSQISYESLKIHSRDFNIIFIISNAFVPKTIKNLCKRSKKNIVFVLRTVSPTDISKFPIKVARNDVDVKSYFDEEFDGKSSQYVLGMRYKTISYGETEIDISQLTNLIDRTSVNYNRLYVSLPTNFIASGEINEDHMYESEKVFPYSIDNGSQMKTASKVGLRMNLYGACSSEDKNKYNFVYGFFDENFKHRTLILEDLTCDDYQVKIVRFLEIYETFSFESSSTWKKLNNKEYQSSDFDLIETYIKSNFGYSLMSSDQTSYFGSTVYWINSESKESSKPSCWKNCFYIEYKGDKKLSEPCLKANQYETYQEGASTYKPVEACNDEFMTMDAIRLMKYKGPQIVFKETPKEGPVFFTLNAQRTYTAAFVEVQGIKSTFYSTGCPCDAIKKGHALFNADSKIIGFVHEVQPRIGYCSLMAYGLTYK
jgi:hypothetical protein